MLTLLEDLKKIKIDPPKDIGLLESGWNRVKRLVHYPIKSPTWDLPKLHHDLYINGLTIRACTVYIQNHSKYRGLEIPLVYARKNANDPCEWINILYAKASPCIELCLKSHITVDPDRPFINLRYTVPIPKDACPVGFLKSKTESIRFDIDGNLLTSLASYYP